MESDLDLDYIDCRKNNISGYNLSNSFDVMRMLMDMELEFSPEDWKTLVQSAIQDPIGFADRFHFEFMKVIFFIIYYITSYLFYSLNFNHQPKNQTLRGNMMI